MLVPRSLRNWLARLLLSLRRKSRKVRCPILPSTVNDEREEGVSDRVRSWVSSGQGNMCSVDLELEDPLCHTRRELRDGAAMYANTTCGCSKRAGVVARSSICYPFPARSQLLLRRGCHRNSEHSCLRGQTSPMMLGCRGLQSSRSWFRTA